MKFSVAYYLLLLYITVIVKPLIPMMNDAWDHAFAEAKHIATVHAKYGANHLEKQVAAEEQDTNNKTQNATKAADPVPVHIPENTCNYNVAVLQTGINFLNIPVRPLPSIAGTIVVPPPDFTL